MVSIDAMHAINCGFTAPTPHSGTNYRKYVGSSERVKRGNLDFRKR